MTKVYRLESAGHGLGHVAQTVQVLPDKDMTRAYDLPEVDTGKGHGFGWSYAGTGAAILAASLVADVFGEQPTRQRFYEGACRAALHMQAVKTRFLVSLRRDIDVHLLDAEQIRLFCLEREEPCEFCQGAGEELVGASWMRCGSCQGLRVQRRQEATS